MILAPQVQVIGSKQKIMYFCEVSYNHQNSLYEVPDAREGQPTNLEVLGDRQGDACEIHVEGSRRENLTILMVKLRP